MKRIELFNDHFQNFKVYGIPHAQLIIADPPYNLGKNAYASNPAWYVDGDNKNGESNLAGKEFFDTDKDFRPAEFMHFCSQMLVKEPKKGKGGAPCMVLFCEFEQQFKYIELGQRYGFQHYIPLVFRKDYSAQVLKANMRVVGNCEYGLILYKDKLPKFNNGGGMVFNCMDYPRELGMAKTHPTQKPLPLLRRLVELFTDPEHVMSRAYDLVLNGYEQLSGSIRIYDQNMQEKVFESIGMTMEQAHQKFGFFLDAFQYGTPPHCGVGIGLERLTMVLAGTENIRDVVAFPTTNSSMDLMSESPNVVDKAQLDILGIEIKDEVKKA